MFYDLELRTDINLLPSEKQKIWLFSVGICFITTLSVIRSASYINLDTAFFCVFVGMSAIVILQLINNSNLTVSSADVQGRIGGGMAMSSLVFGQKGTQAAIIALSYFAYRHKKRWKEVLAFLLFAAGLFITLRSGSRGPLLSLLIVILVWLFTRAKNRLGGIILLLFVISMMIIFSNELLNIVNQVSPVLVNRIENSLNEGDISGRETFFKYGINSFFDSPIFGKQLLVDLGDGKVHYTHNSIIDSLMGLGILGGLIFVAILFLSIRYCILGVKNGTHIWLYMFAIQSIFFQMSSMPFFQDQLFSVVIAFIFMESHNNLQKIY